MNNDGDSHSLNCQNPMMCLQTVLKNKAMKLYMLQNFLFFPNLNYGYKLHREFFNCTTKQVLERKKRNKIYGPGGLTMIAFVVKRTINLQILVLTDGIRK